MSADGLLNEQLRQKRAARLTAAQSALNGRQVLSATLTAGRRSWGILGRPGRKLRPRRLRVRHRAGAWGFSPFPEG